MLVGIDEAGRGALAGPLFMAACALKSEVKGLCDSKLLSEKKREIFYEKIIFNSNFLILSFDAEKIDKIGLSVCLKQGLEIIKMHFLNLKKFGFLNETEFLDFKFENSCEQNELNLKNRELNFLYDGNTNFKVKDIKTLIKADKIVSQVSAASILAKVARDKVMRYFAKILPEYEFDLHKAYGTKRHKELISRFGISFIHRKSFKLSF